MSQEEDPSTYLNRLAKHPRLSRTPVNARADQFGGRIKQPRPLEDGNWICEDPSCGNVNYPRRTECNKCGKRRGPTGDAVVKAYVDTIKMHRGELPMSPSMLSSEVLELGAEGRSSSLGRSYVSSPSLTGMLQEQDLWMPGSFDAHQSQQLLQHQALQQQQEQASLAAQYISGDSKRRISYSTALEGKRLAEQLVAVFATSPNPIGDAGECLASATLWLQNMKQRMLVPSPLDMAIPGAASEHGPSFGSPSGISRSPGPVGQSSPSSRYGGFTESGWSGGSGSYSGLGHGLGGSGSFGQGSSSLQGGSAGASASSINGLIGSQLGYTRGGSPGALAAYMGGLGVYSPRSNPGGNLLGVGQGGARLASGQRAGVRFEDYKDRPSEYLREFGDPAAMNAAAGVGGNQRPETGVNGNWECEDCKNVNFPRRSNCFQCHKKRGPRGEEIVREYVRTLIEGNQ